MIKVRITTFARPDEELRIKLLKRYNEGKKHWKNLEFVSGEDYDILIIFTYPYEDTLKQGYDQRKAITIKTEPSLSTYSTSHITSRIVEQFIPLPFLPDSIKGNRAFGGNGERIKKTHLFSAVTSELAGLPGHESRLKFLYTLSHSLKDNIDIFGWKIDGEYFKLLHHYNGYLEDKFNGLWNYKYHFSCENSFEKNYFTEKILDPIISETFCFYDGCPNIFDFIDDRAFQLIDVNNIESSVETIFRKINDEGFETQLKYIRREKKRILTDFHPFKFISDVINERDLDKLLKIN